MREKEIGGRKREIERQEDAEQIAVVLDSRSGRKREREREIERY